MLANRVLAILVGGGPAPGINAVISAAVVEAVNEGLEVVGIADGFKWLIRRDTSKVRPIQIEEVSRIHLEGGWVIIAAHRQNCPWSGNPVQLLRSIGADLCGGLLCR